jgi:mannose-6-phosphate isomerase-like protein (cupin superfamily)
MERMTNDQIRRIREELLREYSGAIIKVTADQAEIIAEIEPSRAVAVIERSLPHFHVNMTEVYRILRGRLFVACAGRGHVLDPGDSLRIESGQIHSARGANEPAWVEVLSEPPWTAEDHIIL